MKAIIMAGGQGSRLRPLTCNLPKPMTRLCGKPVLEYILEHLERNDCHKATLTLGYLPQVIRNHFKTKKSSGVSLHFVEEKTPLGTAGGVANAAKGVRDDFIVISGDALCDFDLKSAYLHHKRSNAAVTIVTTRVEDPREYGLVQVDENNVVTGFTEKPSWSGVTTNLANTGIYIIHPGVLSMIPKNKPYDFAKDLFPQMIREEMVIGSYEATGYWCDIGDLESYRRCQSDLLNGKIAGFDLSGYQADPVRGAQIVPPVYIGARVHIGQGCIIGPGTVLEDDVTVAEGTMVQESILLAGSKIGKKVKLQEAVLCDRTFVGDEAVVLRNAAIGENCCLKEKSVVLPDVVLDPQQYISPRSIAAPSGYANAISENCFHDDGMEGGIGTELTPDFCCHIGKALGSIMPGQRIGIGFENSNGAKGMYHAILAGLISTGVQVLDFGEITKAGMQFATAMCGMDASIYAGGKETGCIQILDSNGMPVGRDRQRQIEKTLQKENFRTCQPSKYRGVADMRGFQLLYQQEIKRFAPTGLVGIQAGVCSENRELERVFTDAFLKLGGVVAEEPTFVLSDDGCRVSAIDEHGKHISAERMHMLASKLLFQTGEDVVVEYAAPFVLDAIATQNGCRCIRLTADGSTLTEGAAALYRGQYFLRDGMMLSFYIMSEMKSKNCTLAELMDSLPEISEKRTQIPLKISPSLAMEYIHPFTRSARQGRKVTLENGIVRIWPDRAGKHLQVFAQTLSQETADELCLDMERKIRDSLDRNG